MQNLKKRHTIKGFNHMFEPTKKESKYKQNTDLEMIFWCLEFLEHYKLLAAARVRVVC